MTWRVAKSLLHLREQVTAKFPDRSKESDGSIGDLRHQHEKTSDHNPWVTDGGTGVVTAIDITHDPRNGFDSYAFAGLLLKNRDPRIKYVISNRRIASGSAGPSPWKWRKYTGSNAHDHHVHISVKSQKALYDSEGDWKIDGLAAVSPDIAAAAPVVKPTLRKGAQGGDVQTLQGRLNAHGASLKVDGDFGDETFKALKNFQSGKKVVADGVCGPQTWKLLS